MSENQSQPESPTSQVTSSTIAPPLPTSAQASTGLLDISEFAKVALRVGQIESAEPVEKSNKLLKLQVNLGSELGSRQVLAGIAKFYNTEQLVGKKIIVVANLKPAKLMGHESQGMLLAASSPDGSQLAIVEPHPEIPLGATVR